MTTQTAPAKAVWSKPVLFNVSGNIGDVHNSSSSGSDGGTGFSTSAINVAS